MLATSMKKTSPVSNTEYTKALALPSSIKDYELMKDQLNFILKTCTDLNKTVTHFGNLETIENKYQRY